MFRGLASMLKAQINTTDASEVLLLRDCRTRSLADTLGKIRVRIVRRASRVHEAFKSDRRLTT